jgi:hypothetical protein
MASMQVEFESKEGEVLSVSSEVLGNFDGFLNMLCRNAKKQPIQTDLAFHDLALVVVLMELGFYPHIRHVNYQCVLPTSDFNCSFAELADFAQIEVYERDTYEDEREFVRYLYPEVVREADVHQQRLDEEEMMEHEAYGDVDELTDDFQTFGVDEFEDVDPEDPMWFRVETGEPFWYAGFD